MEKSDSIKELTSALIKAQGELEVVRKDTQAYNYKYATLPAVFEEYKKHFLKHGLVVIQQVEGMGLRTTLSHESGEWMSSVAALMPIKNDPQAQGSAITYMRRYSLGSICGIMSEEDDDGAKAMPSHSPKVEHKDADPAFIAKREAEKAKMRQTMETVLETKPTASQTHKKASGDIATGLIMYANPKNAGGFRSYALENYQKENGKDMMFSTRDTTMIETLDDRLAKEQKVSFRFVPNENPNFAANIVELIAVE